MDIIETAITIVIAILGSGSIVAAYIQNQYQKLQAIQEKLREERRNVYFNLLSPFILLLLKRADLEKITQILYSEEYNKTAFELVLFGSDEVIRAYTQLMRYFIHIIHKKTDIDIDETIQLVKLLGELLLKIRKDLGNEKTSLNAKDIMTQFIGDIDKIKS